LGRNETGEVLLRGPDDHAGLSQPAGRDRRRHHARKVLSHRRPRHVDDNGFLHITGRKKDLIIVSGEKVYPREVEEMLMGHEAIAEAAVVSRPDESRGEAVVAFVVAKPEQTVTPDAVKKFCRDAGMIGWKIPKDVYVVEDLPRSPTGKVLKRELAAKVRETT
jgi:acyl-CoA synthetase (AMP-forming)/AMP-acid ligase II